MKINSIQSILLVLLAAFFFTTCEDENYEIGPAFSKLEGIEGTWVLDKIIQVDFTRRPVFDIKIDVSDILIGDDPLEVSFDAQNFSYTVDPGTTSHLLGDGSTWRFDDNDYPTAIIFSIDGQDVQANLAKTIRTIDDELQFEFPKLCSAVENPEFGYQYTFIRKNK